MMGGGAQGRSPSRGLLVVVSESLVRGRVPALLAARFRASGRAAIAAVSMGGLGALDDAVRHRGMYSVAASFSGIVDTRLSAAESQGYVDLVASQGGDEQALWGDPSTNPDVWRAHKPLRPRRDAPRR